MFEKIFSKLKNIFFNLNKINFTKIKYDFCYSDMEYDGIASMGLCKGSLGTNTKINYVYDTCIKCPYFVNTKQM